MIDRFAEVTVVADIVRVEKPARTATWISQFFI
jgi:hypothetical protein